MPQDVELAFGVLVAHVCSNERLNQLTQSLGTTRLALTGEYEQNSDTDTVAIIHGFSQYHRLDLKQTTAELVLAQDGGIPLAMKCHSGNAGSNTVFEKQAGDAVKGLQQGSGPPLLAADSKLYRRDNARNLAKLQFITRIMLLLFQAK